MPVIHFVAEVPLAHKHCWHPADPATLVGHQVGQQVCCWCLDTLDGADPTPEHGPYAWRALAWCGTDSTGAPILQEVS
jgi:hypothetical protein